MGVLRLFIVVLLLGSAATVRAQEPAGVQSTAVPGLAPVAPATPAPALVPARPEAAEAQPDGSRSIFTRWWFWTAAGVLVAGAIALGVALQPRDPSCPAGTVCL